MGQPRPPLIKWALKSKLKIEPIYFSGGLNLRSSRNQKSAEKWFIATTMIGGRQAKVAGNGESEVFASCSFSSLGLHPTLCEQLKGRCSLPLLPLSKWARKSVQNSVFVRSNREAWIRGSHEGAGADDSCCSLRQTRVIIHVHWLVVFLMLSQCCCLFILRV